jgi:hypothetical protein
MESLNATTVAEETLNYIFMRCSWRSPIKTDVRLSWGLFTCPFINIQSIKYRTSMYILQWYIVQRTVHTSLFWGHFKTEIKPLPPPRGRMQSLNLKLLLRTSTLIEVDEMLNVGKTPQIMPTSSLQHILLLQCPYKQEAGHAMVKFCDI